MQAKDQICSFYFPLLTFPQAAGEVSTIHIRRRPLIPAC
jgi:hypothetical protein